VAAVQRRALSTDTHQPHYSMPAGQICPNSVPTIGSRSVPLGPSASLVRHEVAPVNSENGTKRDASGTSGILLTSRIMLRSQVRFLLAPPQAQFRTGVLGLRFDRSVPSQLLSQQCGDGVK
jgi:hypothetical protein